MQSFKKFSINNDFSFIKIDSSFIKFCETLSRSFEIKDFLLNLKSQIPKKFKTGELILFYESKQLGLRRAYVKNHIFYEPSAQEIWPRVKNIRFSSIEENLYLAKEFGRPFFTVLMVPLQFSDVYQSCLGFPALLVPSSPRRRNSRESGNLSEKQENSNTIGGIKALLVVEINNKQLVKSLPAFFEERKTVLELSFKRAYLNTYFRRISYLWEQLFSHWWEPLAVLNNSQVLIGNNSFKKNLFSLFKQSLKSKINKGILLQNNKTYKLYYYPLKTSLGVLYCQDTSKFFDLKEQLFQNEKMSLLFDLGQNMAHQLNNPLTEVKAMSQTLKSNPFLKQFKEEFEELEKAIQRIQKIINSFLSFSDQKNQMKICNINQILNDTLLLLKKTIGSINLKIDIYAQKLQTKGNVALLQQAFYNLILNACEALAEDKKNKNPMIQISAYPISDYEICLKIKDNGIGVEPEKLEKIFKPFWTSKQGGTGLGLGIAQKIVQECQGKIFISSKKNQFTCFTLIFPASIPENSQSFSAQANESPSV